MSWPRPLQGAADEYLKNIRVRAREAGLERELDKELAPPPPPEPAEPRERVRVLRAYRLSRQGKYGPETFESAAGAVVDLPASLAKRLGDRVEIVPPGTEIKGVPLQHWMIID
jgi:hypothetical protein